MALLLFYGFIAIFVSFLCSMLEACLLSISRSYVEYLAEAGSRTGQRLRKMKDNIDRPLAAILTLNTIAHTAGAAGVGAQAAVVFGNAAVGIASAIMTLLILVLSEIIPKTLGAVHAEKIAPAAAVTIRGMIILCMPIIIPLEWINRLVGYERTTHRLSRAELVATIHLGHAGGALDAREFQIASNLVALNEVPLRQILTPRTVLFALPGERTVGETIEAHHPLRYARIPVYAENPEHITGYVTRFGLYKAHSAEELDRPLRDIAKDILVFPENASAGKVLGTMIENHQHIALVVDEFGGTVGLIALEDLLETLLGEEIVDETDIVPDMQELALRRARSRSSQEEPPAP